MRGSSVHFKRIASAIHAVSHASREVAPEYLLPEDMSLGTHVVIDDAGQVQRLLEHKLSLASRQAKATKDYSPMWEGVINLPDPADATPQQQIEIVKKWCAAYEKMTGHKVIRADVHLDEGFVDETGKPRFNAHAHVMCDRTDDKGKVKKLTSTVLREVQNMTAEVTTLARGLDARTTGRKHIGHQHFRYDAEKNRLDLEKPKTDLKRLQKLSKEWSDADLAKVNELQSKVTSEPARQAAALAVQKAHLDEQYSQDRAALKASGEAKQADYQALKKEHEAALAKLKDQDFVIGNLLKNEAVLHGKATQMTQENQDLRTENERLEADKAKFALMAAEYQDFKKAGNDPALFVPAPAQSRPLRPAAVPEAARSPQKAEKPITHPTPLPMPEKSLLERLEASYRLFLDWIKAKGGVLVDFDTQQSDHYGPVVQLNDLHAVQSTGRGKHVVHELAKLDRVPALDDSKTEISYRAGVGQVKGRGVGKGGLGE